MKVAMVTGAGSGIGRATSLALLKAGYQRRPRRPAPRGAAADGAGGRHARPERARRRDRRDQARLGEGAVRRDRADLRPPRRAVQQRRHRRAGDPARRADVRAVAGRRRHQPDRRVPVHAAGVPDDEEAEPEGRPHHQQRLDLGPCTAPVERAVHGDQARDHRPDQGDLARRPRPQHRLRPDRHRQRGQRDDDAHDDRRAAGRRPHDAGAAHGREPRRQCRRPHGGAAARDQRAVHDRSWRPRCRSSAAADVVWRTQRRPAQEPLRIR